VSRQKRFSNIFIVIVSFQTLMVGCTSSNLPATASPTIIPSQTSTPVVINQSTPIPATQTPEKTPVPKPIIVYESVSPDTRWTATTTRLYVDEQERSIFKVSNDGGRVEWEVENEVYVDEPPIGFWFPVPFYWSKDGKYLYFAHRASGDGCFGGNNHLGKDLKRLNLITGEVSQISSGGTYMAISPDENYLAAISFGDEGINIQNLSSGKLEILDLLIRHEDLGLETDQRYITWSPDSKSLVFVIMAGVCDFSVESYFNWIVRVDIESLSQTMVTERDEQGLVPISWIEKDKILTRDKEGKLWWMNPSTGEISPIK